MPQSPVPAAAGKPVSLPDRAASQAAPADVVLVIRRPADVAALATAVRPAVTAAEPIGIAAPHAPKDDEPAPVKVGATPRPGASEPAAASMPAPPSRPPVPAATTPVEKPPTPSAAEQVAEAIAGRAEAVRRGGAVDFYMRLDPPDLGTVHVYLRATENSLSARLVVADVGTRMMIESQLPQLRLKLGEAGLSLGGFDVAQQRSDSRQPGRQWQEAPAGGGPPGAVLKAAWVGSVGDVAAGPGRLDVVV